MDDLSPGARALLEAAHRADDPGQADAERIRQAVLAKVSSVGFGAVLFAFGMDHARALFATSVPKFAAVVLLAWGSSAVYQHLRHPDEPAFASQPVAAAAVEASPPTPVASTTLEPQVVAPPASAPMAPSPAVHPAHHSSALDAEMRWVRGADAALRAGNVGAAVELLNRHAREFPHGALREEREGLRVVAACQRGASADVQRAASAFLQAAPHSLMAGRVRAACQNLGG